VFIDILTFFLALYWLYERLKRENPVLAVSEHALQSVHWHGFPVLIALLQKQVD
jgi:hypothetical protein